MYGLHALTMMPPPRPRVAMSGGVLSYVREDDRQVVATQSRDSGMIDHDGRAESLGLEILNGLWSHALCT